MIKKIILLILIFLLVQPVPSLATYVSLTITSETTPSIIEPGEKGNLIITITNNGNDYARDVKVRFKSHSFITFSRTSYDLQTIGPSYSTQVVVPITVSSGATEGTTAIFFSIDYREGDASGTVTKEGSVTISITRRPLIEIKNVTYDKEIIQPGDDVLVSVELKNAGRGGLKDLIVSLKNFTLPFVYVNNEVYLGTLNQDQNKNAEFNLIINNDAETIAYNVPLTLTYYDELGTLHTVLKYFGMKISGRPDFIVNLESEDNMYSGGKGSLTISIANRGTASAEFLTVRFDTGLDVTPKEYYIGDVEPDDYETISLDINLGNVNVGKHILNMDMLYKDTYNQELSESVAVDFSVTQRPIEIPIVYQIILVLVIVIVVYWKKGSIIRLFKK